ncbi:MAG TPA: DNA-3-methyladenine glycosylase [Patescibacteria group bacterium]|nr:DNA-3-methyladenine glycosylase [Patescibacteria group bacterium]
MSERKPMAEHLQLLSQDFFIKESLTVAPALIGCVIETNKDGLVTSGKITETEAYPSHDAASHAFKGKRTPRTEIQFAQGGRLYMYQIMGLHFMTSIVVGEENNADVVFIRSIEPLSGVEKMKERRKYISEDIKRLASGPGMLSVALGLNKDDNGLLVYNNDSKVKIYKDKNYTAEVATGKRINLGIHGATPEEGRAAIEQLWRFFDKNSKFLSR